MTMHLIFKAATLTALFAAASGACAQVYPAADFKPSVVYLAPDFASHTSGAASGARTAHDPKYPAATFEPTVVYQAKDLAAHSSAAAATTPYDPKYPAAHFEPKVIYPAK